MAKHANKRRKPKPPRKVGGPLKVSLTAEQATQRGSIATSTFTRVFGNAYNGGRHRGSWPIVPLTDGTVGYGMEFGRTDTCLKAALATLVQVSPERFPALRLEDAFAAGRAAGVSNDEIHAQLWEQIAAWLKPRGLELSFHDQHLPVDRDRWIGVCAITPKRIVEILTLCGRIDTIPLELRPCLDDPKVQSHPTVIEQFEAEFGQHNNSDHCLVMRGDQVLFDPAVSLEVPPGSQLLEWGAEHVTYGITVDPISTKENR